MFHSVEANRGHYVVGPAGFVLNKEPRFAEDLWQARSRTSTKDVSHRRLQKWFIDGLRQENVEIFTPHVRIGVTRLPRTSAQRRAKNLR